MAFHESFWVATSAVAPVIALAAVVALPDATSIVGRATHDRAIAEMRPSARDDPFAIAVARATQRWSLLAWGITLVNLIIQAGLLTVSLWALAYNQDVMPPAPAIILAAGGILLLAWSTTVSAQQRWSQKLAPSNNDADHHREHES